MPSKKIPPRFPLVRYLQTEGDTNARVQAMLADALRTLNAQLSNLPPDTSAVTRMQLEAQAAAIKSQLGRSFSRLGPIVEEGRREAARAASEVVSEYEEELTRLAATQEILDAVRASEAQRAAAGVDTAMTRMGLSETPLAEQVYNTRAYVSGQIDAMINSALARGLTWQEFAKEMRNFVNPNTPGGASYAANRLARTEINNAFHASAAERFNKSNIVTGVDWHLSTSHPEGDICDELKDGSPYPKNEVPKKPHPFCLCFITPVVPSQDDFLDNLFAGKYDDEEWNMAA